MGEGWKRAVEATKRTRVPTLPLLGATVCEECAILRVSRLQLARACVSAWEGTTGEWAPEFGLALVEARPIVAEEEE